MQKDYYLNQKKAMEINPRHPLIKELLRRVEDNPEDAVAKDMSLMMFQTATLRSGYIFVHSSLQIGPNASFLLTCWSLKYKKAEKPISNSQVSSNKYTWPALQCISHYTVPKHWSGFTGIRGPSDLSSWDEFSINQVAFIFYLGLIPIFYISGISV